ncbi:MAG: hypothetical protein AB1705_20985 [Verrucomicrobiota bacterium]
MTASPLSLTDNPPPETKPQFNIVLAYADMETAKRGKQVHDRLVAELGNECTFILRLWKFDVLRDAKLRAQAAKEAADANMLIISTHGGRDLPRAVKSWVRTSLKEKRESPAALVALLEGRNDPPKGPRSVRAYLCKQAVRHKLDFFACAEESHTDAPPEPVPVHINIAMPPSDEERSPYAHWGINE